MAANLSWSSTEQAYRPATDLRTDVADVAEDKPHEIVGRICDALPAGSLLALSHTRADIAPAQWKAFQQSTRAGGITSQARSLAEVTAFLDGLDLLDPGVGPVRLRRPDGVGGQTAEELRLSSVYGGVARKPV